MSREWTRVSFGDVVRLSRERSASPERDGLDRYVGLDHLDPGSLNVRRWGHVAEGTTFTSVFRPGQVLFGKRRAYQGKVALADFSGVCSGDIYVFEVNGSSLLPELLPFICQTSGFLEYAVGTSAGSLSPRTSWSSLADYQFTLPPIGEQRRIVSLLLAIVDTRDLYVRACEAATASTQALIAHLLSQVRRFTTDSRLQDHADVTYGLTVEPRRRNVVEQIPYLRVANVQRGRLDLTDVKTVGRGLDDDAYRLASGDLLIVEGHADASQVGRAAIWRNESAEMFHQNHVIRIRCHGSLKPEFLYFIMNAVHGRSYFRSHAKSTSGLNTINSTVVKRYNFPVPPLSVQAGVVQKVEVGMRLIERLAWRENALAGIHRTALDRLRRGES